MDHETCSDLLAPYARGELSARDEQRVSDHLEACADCRMEERGLRTLLADPVEDMTETERATLHSRLRNELELPSPAPPQRLAWLPPALATAALLLVVVVGIQLFGDGGGEGAGEGVRDRADAGPQPITLSFTERGLEPRARAVSTEAAGDESADTVEDAASDPESGEPQKDEAAEVGAAAPGGDVSESNAGRARRGSALTRYARSGKAFVSFAETYAAEDAAVLRDVFTERLAQEAPSEAKDQVVECADFVVESRPYPTLPAAAAHGTYGDEESLLLGFVWTQEETGPLDHYLLFVWPRGTCETPSHSQIGRIRTGRD